MDLIINELSLDGQFVSIDAFVELLDDFIRIIKIAEEHSMKILKKYDLYDRKISEEITLRELLKTKGNDRYTRVKSILLRNSYSPPFWEEDQRHTQEKSIKYKCYENLYGSSLAEAVYRDNVVISFKHALFMDKHLVLSVDEIEHIIFNAIDEGSFIEILHFSLDFLGTAKYCAYKYGNTRLSFEKFEEEYGFGILEKSEEEMVLESFDRFAEKKDWKEIYQDQSLNYKEYQPNRKKDNWFRGTSYEGITIDKFRCGNTAVAPLRCFGYRDGETFYALRLERDHKKSDKG